MAKANIILLNSILWNLREITKLAERIKKHCGDVDCTSWRYPLASCSELEIFKLLQNNRNLDSYTYILELTYDRLLYVFNLIIKYLESTDSLEKFRPSRNVHRPKTLSLASVLCMVWDRIRARSEIGNEIIAVERKETNESSENIEIKGSKSSACTQSEICSISVCSCCEMVQQFVTHLILEMEKIMEKQELTSAISSERKHMREFLFEMTNWSAMSKWLAAIVKDFTTISEKAEQATISSRKLRHRLDSGERKMKTRIDQHEAEMQNLNTRLQEHETKAAEMKERIADLEKEKNQKEEEIKAKNSELAEKTSNFESRIAELKKKHEAKLTKVKEKKAEKDSKKEIEWKKKLESESKKREEMEVENGKLKETIETFKQDLDNVKSKTNEDKNALTSRCEKLETEIENLKGENSSLNSVITEKQKIIDDYSIRLMQAFPELNVNSKPKYKASGNPEIDMENQIEANKLRMNLLNSENEKLRNTLSKIKAIKG